MGGHPPWADLAAQELTVIGVLDPVRRAHVTTDGVRMGLGYVHEPAGTVKPCGPITDGTRVPIIPLPKRERVIRLGGWRNEPAVELAWAVAEGIYDAAGLE